MEFPEVENLHDYYSTDGSCIHTQDQRGLYIIYDVALVDLQELEQHLLLTASHFIQRSRGQGRCFPPPLNYANFPISYTIQVKFICIEL